MKDVEFALRTNTKKNQNTKTPSLSTAASWPGTFLDNKNHARAVSIGCQVTETAPDSAFCPLSNTTNRTCRS